MIEKDYTMAEYWIEPDSTTTELILGYFGRTSDREQVRTAIVNRYGTGIKSVKLESGDTIETYAKDGFLARMSAGHIEVVCLGYGHKIVDALATLFSSSQQRFNFVSMDGEDVTKNFDWFLDYRSSSQYIEKMNQADRESIQVGCSLVYVSYSNDQLKYRVIDPGKVRVCYKDYINTVDGLRTPDFTELEDAYCVIIETGVSSDGKNKNYTAIFSRSVEYPNGRFVSYTAGDSNKAPDVGEDGAVEWFNDAGEIANPLSQYANDNPALNVPEFPLAIIYGGNCRMDTLLPISDSLLQESLELDISASHIRSCCADDSRGTLVLEREQAGVSAPLPTSLRGEVSLSPGQTIKAIPMDAGSSKTAWEVTKEQMISSAQSYGIPDYMVSSEDHTVEAASGVALTIRTQPLKSNRETRIAINRPAVEKIFEIEKMLLVMYSEDDVVEDLLTVYQQWEPGETTLPVDKLQETNITEILYERGVIDTIEYIRRVYNLPNELEAIAKYEVLNQRAKKYPPITVEKIPQ